MGSSQLDIQVHRLEAHPFMLASENKQLNSQGAGKVEADVANLEVEEIALLDPAFLWPNLLPKVISVFHSSPSEWIHPGRFGHCFARLARNQGKNCGALMNQTFNLVRTSMVSDY